MSFGLGMLGLWPCHFFASVAMRGKEVGAALVESGLL